MTTPPAADRYDRILHAVGGVFDRLGAWPDHPRALEGLADAVEQLIAAELETSQRRTVTLVERIDAARAWARQHLTPELEGGLLAALRGDEEPRTVLDTPAGQPAINRILADADHHDECARQSTTPEGAISHSSIAGGLRIAVQHVRRGHDAEVAMLRQRLQLAATGLDDGTVSLRKADVDLATAVRSRDGWRRDYAELAELYKTTRARAERAEVQLAALHQGEEPHADDLVVPTPAQWIWQWNRATPEQRLDMAGRILQAFETAEACFLLNHKTEALRRKAAEAAVERVRALAAELDDGCLWTSSAPAIADQIRDALEPPKEARPTQ